MNEYLARCLDAFVQSPEFFTFLAAIAVLIWEGIGGKDKPWVSAFLTLFALIIMVFLSLFSAEPIGVTFFGSYTHDGLARFMNVIFSISGIFTVLAAWHFVRKWSRSPGVFYVLLLFAIFGMMLMVSSTELIMLFVATETTTISLYLLTAYFKEDKLSAEASMKFIILGTVFAIILLFGMVLIYGATGTTVLADIAEKATAAQWSGSKVVLFAGILMVFVGLSFKITAVPFHMWAPDAYTGAPTPVTAFLSVASKASGFAVIIRLFYGVFSKLAGLEAFLAYLFVILAALTMILGNFLALPQKNIKRLLAYSSIAQAGYMIIGLASFTNIGVSSILFYLAQYMFANFGIFIVVTLVYNQEKSDDISSYIGLSRRSPFVALVLLVCLLSLAGIPPLAGFLGKAYLFAAGLDKGYYMLVTVGILTSIVSVYYYLIVLKHAYIIRALEPASMPVSFPAKIGLWVSLAGVIGLGLFPSVVIDSVQVVNTFLAASMH